MGRQEELILRAEGPVVPSRAEPRRLRRSLAARELRPLPVAGRETRILLIVREDGNELVKKYNTHAFFCARTRLKRTSRMDMKTR